MDQFETNLLKGLIGEHGLATLLEETALLVWEYNSSMESKGFSVEEEDSIADQLDKLSTKVRELGDIA